MPKKLPTKEQQSPSLATLIPPANDLPRLMSVSDVAKRYGWGRTTTYYLIAEGKLTAYKMGAKKLLITTQSCEDYVATLKPASIRCFRPRRSSGVAHATAE